MRYAIEHQSVLDWAKTYTGPKFHALICDPPYHLTSITDRFGGENSAPAQFGKDGAFGRVSKGFMGSTWDGGDIAFRPETWAAIAEHLHPGAFGMAFASTRGFHRMAVAIEDAGLLIHPTIFCWGFGSGFPKATRLDTTIDERAFQDWLDGNPDKKEWLEAFRVAALQAKRAAKANPDNDVFRALAKATETAHKNAKKQIKEESGFARVVGKKPQTGAKFKQAQALIDNGGFNDPDRADFDLTAPTTDLAQQWAGHRYGLQALKPALEPIIIFQKPYAGDPVSSITATGAGAWNIDAGRIEGRERTEYGLQNATRTHGAVYGKPSVSADFDSTLGRWPSNLILSHSPLCADDCAPDCPVRRLGEQSGESVSKNAPRGMQMVGGHGGSIEGYRLLEGSNNARGHDDSGTAARFFFNSDHALDRLEDSDPLLYVAKASSTERDAGLHQLGAITVDDGRDKPIDNAYQRGETSRFNPHPTIKPIALIKHLASLLLPPEGYESRLLIPFSGAGSEMIGALLAGWSHVTGIELEAKHVDVARLRLDWWFEASRLSLSTEPKEILEQINPATPAIELNKQLTLMDLLS